MKTSYWIIVFASILIAGMFLFPNVRSIFFASVSKKRRNLGHAQKGNDSGGVLTQAAGGCE
jgi:hypothetical protein